MDDFLHNLRSGKLKQPDRGRRDYTDYKGPQRRATTERRRPDYYTKVTGENFALVKNSLDTLTEQQKRIADAMAAREKTESRIADALEAIAAMMGRYGGDQGVESQRSEPAKPEPDGNTMGSIIPTEVIDDRAGIGNEKSSEENKPRRRDIIASMRADGNSWEKIARHLDDQNFPTVSGKGKWRGPAVKKFWEANT